MLQNRLVLNTLVSQSDYESGVTQPKIVDELIKTGVSNIELRREYENQTLGELQKLSQIRFSNRLTYFYSIPDDLFVNHQLNLHLLQYVAEAQLLGVSFIKMTLGDFDKPSSEIVDTLLSIIPTNIQLNIENDQSSSNSNTHKLSSFFKQFDGRSQKVGFVNDLGNWIFSGQDAEKSSQTMLAYTRFVHLKSYQLDTDKHPTTVSFSKGELNWKRLLNLFDSQLPVALEYSTNTQELTKDLNTLKQYK